MHIRHCDGNRLESSFFILWGLQEAKVFLVHANMSIEGAFLNAKASTQAHFRFAAAFQGISALAFLG